MEILIVHLQIGTQNMGFSAQFPAKKGPGNLTPNEGVLFVQGSLESLENGRFLLVFLHFANSPASLVGACSTLSGTKIASQNRNDHGGRKRARNHSAAEIAGFFVSAAAKKIASR